MSKPKTIDLSEAFQPIPPVKLRDGRTVNVKPFSGHDIKLRQELAENPNDSALWYDLAKRCLPELTEEEVVALSEPEVTVVVTLATEKYDVVLEMLAEQGKARALIATAEGGDSAPSSSTPESQLATSAPS